MTVKIYSVWDDELFEEKHARNSTNGMVHLVVKHEDYAALLKERDALAAENSTIKTMNDCLAEELRGYESDGAFDGPDMHKLWHSHAGALPATDAALANIQAQGVDMAKEITRREACRSEMINADVSSAFSGLAEDLEGLAAELRKGAGK